MALALDDGAQGCEVDSWQLTGDVDMEMMPPFCNPLGFLDGRGSSSSGDAEPVELEELMAVQRPLGTWTRPKADELPPSALLRELTVVNFEKFYRYEPILHKPSLVHDLGTSGPKSQSAALLFAISAVAATAHHDAGVRQCAAGWYERARSCVFEAMHGKEGVLETLQAAVMLVHQSLRQADYSTAWILLGEAWRKAVMAGCPRLDGKALPTRSELGKVDARRWAAREEGRRTVWALYAVDRGTCTFDLSMAVDDRSLSLNLPMAEAAFQRTEEPAASASPGRFSADPDRLLEDTQVRTRDGRATVQQYILVVYSLLGKMGDAVYRADGDGDGDSDAVLDDLADKLLRLRLMLPRWATSLAAARVSDLPLVVWLNAVLSAATIYLHHRPRNSEDDDEASDDEEEEEEEEGEDKGWRHCVAAAHGLVGVLRDAARTSTDHVALNWHILPLVFTCSRVLTTEYLLLGGSRGQSSQTRPAHGVDEELALLRGDLEVLRDVFRQSKEALDGSGRKFYNGFVFFLRQGVASARAAKAGTVVDMLRPCDQWPSYVDDDEVCFPH
jgi:hypothetical protein